MTFLLLILANLFLGASSSSHYNDFKECLIDRFQLSNLATDIIYTPQNATYASLLLAPNLRPASAAPRRPDLIVTPFHVSEIKAAIHCSRELGLQIRVKSGGHDFEGLSYASTSAPFVMVDMRNFRSVSVDKKTKTAWVQVGATLGQLYHAIARKSKTLAFSGGICPTVGVGGHLSGGGYGMMSRKHGLAADNILDAKVINTDGEVLDRRSMGEDLFWAIRGAGGASFGIILEFKVRLVTIPEMVTVFKLRRTEEQNVTGLVYKWQHIADKLDENLVIRVYLGSENRRGWATFVALYLGRARELLQIMEEKFPELGLVKQDYQEMTWLESVLPFAEMAGQTTNALLDRTPNFIAFMKDKSDYVTAPIPVSGLREMWRFLFDQELALLQLNPYGGALDRLSESETPFPHRKGNRFMVHYSVSWKSLADSEAKIGWIRRLYGFMARHVTKNPRAVYFNYRDLDIGRNNEGVNNTSYNEASVWGVRYFKNNFRRLVEIKTKVDPSNFFRNEQSIPPLLD